MLYLIGLFKVSAPVGRVDLSAVAPDTPSWFAVAALITVKLVDAKGLILQLQILKVMENGEIRPKGRSDLP